MPNYQPSTRQANADYVCGLHIKTTDAGLVAANFTSGAQTELFNVVGRIQLKQLFIEITAAAAAQATLVTFNYTMSTPVVGAVALNVATATISTAPAHSYIRSIGGAVGSVAVWTPPAGGIADVTADGSGGSFQVLGGEQADSSNTVGTIGMLVAVTQLATISGTAHCYYVPMSDGAYVTAVAGV